MSSSALMGRSLIGPPGMPDDRVAALRAAFQAMLKDPAFVEAAKKRNHDIIPASGEEAAAAATKTVSLPKEVAAELTKIFDQ
jgi:tripartite-type tricarboxylate transporter receptor subunit TctC